MVLETEFAEIVETIATNLGIAAERIFGVFVGAQPVIGGLNIVSAIVVFGAAYLSWKYSRKFCIIDFKDENGDWRCDDDEISAIVYPIVVAIVVLIAMWLLTGSIADSILKILCPEYTAMKEIIGLVR